MSSEIGKINFNHSNFIFSIDRVLLTVEVSQGSTVKVFIGEWFSSGFNRFLVSGVRWSSSRLNKISLSGWFRPNSLAGWFPTLSVTTSWTDVPSGPVWSGPPTTPVSTPGTSPAHIISSSSLARSHRANRYSGAPGAPGDSLLVLYLVGLFGGGSCGNKRNALFFIILESVSVVIYLLFSFFSQQQWKKRKLDLVSSGLVWLLLTWFANTR